MDPDYAVFVSIVDSGSLSAAARQLHLSPAMVSKRLARLEARLGIRLIHRTTRRLAPTDTGARLHADITPILRTLAEAEARVTGAADVPSGLVRVSAPTSFGRLHIAPHLARFLRAHPRVTLRLDLDDAAVDLFAGKVDLAVRVTAAVPTSLAAHRLAANRRVLCASPAYLADHGTPDGVAALAGHRLLAADGQMPWRLASGPVRQVVDAASHVATNSSEIVRELALAGGGIALRSLWDVADALADGRLVRVLPGWEGPDDLAIYAVHPRVPVVAPAVAAFTAFLREVVDEHAWSL